MQKAAVAKLMRMIGIQTITDTGEWLNGHCPFGHLHSKGFDEHPSFGVYCHEDKPSYYHCFGCMDGAKSLEHLLFRLWRSNHPRWKRAAELFLGNETKEEVSPLIEAWKSPWDIPDEPERKLPASVLKIFPELIVSNGRAAKIARKTLNKRGIPDEVWGAFGVRLWDYKECFIFPFTLFNGEIKVLQVRSIHAKKMFTISSKLLKAKAPFPTLKTSGAMFGLHLIDYKKPMILTEGPLDAMRLATLGMWNAVAIGGKNLCKSQQRNLLSSVVRIGLDCDKPGMAAGKKIQQALQDKHVLFRYRWDFVGCKDPGELESSEQLKTVRKKARLLH